MVVVVYAAQLQIIRTAILIGYSFNILSFRRSLKVAYMVPAPLHTGLHTNKLPAYPHCQIN